VSGQWFLVVLLRAWERGCDPEAGRLALRDLKRPIHDIDQARYGLVDLAKVGQLLVFDVRKISHDHVARDLGLLLCIAYMDRHGDRSVRGSRHNWQIDSLFTTCGLTRSLCLSSSRWSRPRRHSRARSRQTSSGKPASNLCDGVITRVPRPFS